MFKLFRKIKELLVKPSILTSDYLIDRFMQNGQIPWSEGYSEYKEKCIKSAIENISLFCNSTLPEGYGYRLDERIIEYPWTLNLLSDSKTKIFDAGSVLNYDFIVDHPKLKEKELYIQTFYPEHDCFWNKRISYVFEDLRNIPFKNDFFEEIVCISTIEHIDMDNSIYGYTFENKGKTIEKSYEYLKVINELMRVLKHQGTLLLTFPFGIFENHGFFQQFDQEMLFRITDILTNFGEFNLDFFLYKKTGWNYAKVEDCQNEESYNPHTKIGLKDDFAAHCRAICCIKFRKSK